MVQLFSGLQSSLAMVYDREMGLMRLLLTAPLPRWWVLACKLLATTVLFWQRDRAAGMLFIPYACWVAFATVLNAALWRLN